MGSEPSLRRREGVCVRCVGDATGIEPAAARRAGSGMHAMRPPRSDGRGGMAHAMAIWPGYALPYTSPSLRAEIGKRSNV